MIKSELKEVEALTERVQAIEAAEQHAASSKHGAQQATGRGDGSGKKTAACSLCGRSLPLASFSRTQLEMSMGGKGYLSTHSAPTRAMQHAGGRD